MSHPNDSGRDVEAGGHAFDAQLALDPAGLAGASARAAGFVLATQLARALLQVASLAWLARMLAPAEFGVVGMVSAVFALLAGAKDLGLASATVQRPTIREEQVSVLFWINAGLGVALAVAAAALAPAVAHFYGVPEAAPIATALAASFALSGVAVQHEALLRRRLRFRAVATIELAATAGAIAVGTGLAMAGAGAWALVGIQLATPAFAAIAFWWASGWRPARPRRGGDVAPLLRFGGFTSAAATLNVTAQLLDKMLVGRVAGAAALGFYGRAWTLLFMPAEQLTQAVSRVAVPVLARLQGDTARYRSFYRRAVGALALATMPVAAFSATAAETIVATVLGDAWLDAAAPLRALAPAAFVASFNVATAWVFLTWGHTDRQLRWALVSSATTIAALFVGARFGATGVAAAYSAAIVGLRAPGVLYCFHGTPLRGRDLADVLWRPALASVVAAVALWAAAAPLERVAPSAPLRLALAAVAFAALYAAGLAIVPGGASLLRDAARLLRPARGASSDAAA